MWASSCWKRRTRVRPCSAPLYDRRVGVQGQRGRAYQWLGRAGIRDSAGGYTAQALQCKPEPQKTHCPHLNSLRCSTPKSARRSGSSRYERLRLPNIRQWPAAGRRGCREVDSKKGRGVWAWAAELGWAALRGARQPHACVTQHQPPLEVWHCMRLLPGAQAQSARAPKRTRAVHGLEAKLRLLH